MIYGEKVIIERVEKFLQRNAYLYYGERLPLSITFTAADEPIPIGDLEKRDWKRIQPGQCWGNQWTSAWFRLTGRIPMEWKGCEVVAVIDTGGEGCVFDDGGNPVRGLTSRSTVTDPLYRKAMVPVAKKAQGGESVDLLVEAAANELLGLQGEVRLKAGDLAVFRRDLWSLFHDLTFLFDLAVSLPEGELRRARILRALDRALNEFANGGKAEINRAGDTLKEQLDKKNGEVAFQVSAIGHGHLDLVWLWPLRETIRKAGRTFSSSLRCMEEYPEYKFTASQPQLYQLVKERYPGLFEQKMGTFGGDVGGAGLQHTIRGIPGSPDLLRKALLQRRVRSRGGQSLAARHLRLQSGSASTDAQKRREVFYDPENVLE